MHGATGLNCQLATLDIRKSLFEFSPEVSHRLLAMGLVQPEPLLVQCPPRTNPSCIVVVLRHAV